MRKTAAFTATVLIILTAGCSNQTNLAPEAAIFHPGLYAVTVDGYNGPLTVETTFSNSQITRIEVTDHNETPGVGDTAMLSIANEIIDAQSFAVDVVSGATWSSMALLEAVSISARDAGADVSIITRDSGENQEGENSITPPPPWKPGRYTASAHGYHGELTLTVEVDETSILSVYINAHNETEGIGTNAVEQLPDLIAAASSADIDTVTGATVTSDAILEATVLALKDAQR